MSATRRPDALHYPRRFWRLTFYPEIGAEYLDSRYTGHDYCTQSLNARSLGRKYAPTSATNLFLGLLVSVRITERMAFNAFNA